MDADLKLLNEAELSVIGSCLVGGTKVAVEVFSIINPSDFYNDTLRTIALAVFNLLQRGTEINVITVGDELRSKNQLERIGGVDYLADVSLHTVATANAKAYAEIIKNESNKRKISRLGEFLTNHAGDISVESAVGEIEKTLSSIDVKKEQSKTNVLSEIVQELGSKKKRGLYSGFFAIDKYIWFSEKSLNLLAARPGMGKTSLALNIMLNLAQKGQKALFISLEMSKKELLKRCISILSGVPFNHIEGNTLSQSELNSVIETAASIDEMPFYIVDSNDTLKDVDLTIKHYVRTDDIRLVIIDYLQLIRDRTVYNNKVLEVTNISRDLKLLARKTNIPFLVLTQLNREIEKRNSHEPQLSDLRESGSLEQDADTVMFLYAKDKQSFTVGNMMLKVAKNRNGEIGQSSIQFIKSIQKFRDFNIEEGI